MTMPWIFDDGGRAAAGYRGEASDCVTRAVAIATGRSYREVYAALNDAATRERPRRGRRSSARSGVRKATIRRYLADLGWCWTPTMRIGSGCTVHLRADELPVGRLIVAVSKHLTCVIDGVIHDTFNPSDRGVTLYSPNSSDVPLGAVRRDDGFYVYAPDRCVYGYWFNPTSGVTT